MGLRDGHREIEESRVHLWSASMVAVLLVAASLLLVQLSAGPPAARADGQGSPDACLDDPGSVAGSVTPTGPDLNVVVHEVAAGNIVTGVCIKSGDQTFGGNQHSTVMANGNYDFDGNLVDGSDPNLCYTVAGVGTQRVTVARKTTIISGPVSSDCQEIGHIDVVFEEEEEGTLEIFKACQIIGPDGKVLDPPPPEGNFPLDVLDEELIDQGASVARTANLEISCGETKAVSVPPGLYSVVESEPYDPDFFVLGNFCIEIRVEAGETSECQITNEKRQPGTLIVKKDCLAFDPATQTIEPITGEGNFSLRVTSAPAAPGRTFNLACGESTTLPVGIPGTLFVFEEEDPDDQFNELGSFSFCLDFEGNFVPADGIPGASVEVRADRTSECTIVNEKLRSVTPPQTGDAGLDRGGGGLSLVWLVSLLPLAAAGAYVLNCRLRTR
jgi:hypothetical protein